MRGLFAAVLLVLSMTLTHEVTDPDQQFLLGRSYENGIDGYPKDPEKAAYWFEKAASNGHKEASGVLGVFYSRGLGVEKDYKKAIEWYRRGIHPLYTDSGIALYGLGYAYSTDQGVRRDLVEAYKWFHLSKRESNLPSAVKTLTDLEAILSEAEIQEAKRRAEEFIVDDFGLGFKKSTKPPQWGEDVSSAERQDILEYLRGTGSYWWGGGTAITKVDLDGTGGPEFLMHWLWAEVDEAKSVRPHDGNRKKNKGVVLGVLRSRDGVLDFEIVEGPTDPRLGYGKYFKVLDFNRDGLKDLIRYYSYEAYGSEPDRTAIVFRNAGGQFTRVYKNQTYGELEFRDVDSDGAVELLETSYEGPSLGVASPPVWVRPLSWDGKGFRERDPSALSCFYQSKRKEYEASQGELEETKRTGGWGPIQEELEVATGVLQQYIERIDTILAGHPCNGK